MSQSPKITAFEWGRVDVAGFDAPFRDVKLWPGGAREWDWSEHDTHHEPGIQPADVEELLEYGATVVVLSKGVHERLHTMPQTLAMLEQRGVTAHVLQTEAAVEMYNQLCESEPVGALIHSTC